MSDKQESLTSIITGFPKYAFEYLFGFLFAALSDITLTSLTVGSVALGFATSNLYVGLATFFLVHTGIKMVNAVNSARIQQGRYNAAAIDKLTQVFAQVQPAVPTPEPPTEE